MKYIILGILTACYLFRFYPFGTWLESDQFVIWLLIHYGLVLLIAISLIVHLIRYFKERRREDLLIALSYFSFTSIIYLARLDDQVDFLLKRNIMETHCSLCLENMRNSPLGKVNAPYKSAYTEKANCFEFDTSYSFNYHSLSSSMPMKDVKWDRRYYYKGHQPPIVLKRENGCWNMVFRMDDNWYLIYYKQELFK